MEFISKQKMNFSNIKMGELGQVRIYTTCENPKKTMKITKNISNLL